MATSVECVATNGDVQHLVTSRVGREQQRYGPNHERLVAGIVPLSHDKSQVLLIRSTRRDAWVLPKGGWELDEETADVAATREAWEEAGIIVKVERDLGDDLTVHSSASGTDEDNSPADSTASIPEPADVTANEKDKSKKDKKAKKPRKEIYRFFEAIVLEEKDEWPEREKRKRKWLDYSEAKVMLESRPELLEALNRSGVDKSR